jgi:hypothetical protein
MMRFAGAAAVAAVIAALVVWKISWNIANNGHLDQGPSVASGLSRPVEADDGDRTIVASQRDKRIQFCVATIVGDTTAANSKNKLPATALPALDVAVFPGAAALDIGGVGVDSPPFPHGLGHDRAPIPSRAVDKTVRVLGSSPHCSTNHSGLAEIFLRLRQKPRFAGVLRGRGVSATEHSWVSSPFGRSGHQQP